LKRCKNKKYYGLKKAFHEKLPVIRSLTGKDFTRGCIQRFVSPFMHKRNEVNEISDGLGRGSGNPAIGSVENTKNTKFKRISIYIVSKMLMKGGGAMMNP
jgi:hypothetical protein